MPMYTYCTAFYIKDLLTCLSDDIIIQCDISHASTERGAKKRTIACGKRRREKNREAERKKNTRQNALRSVQESFEGGGGREGIQRRNSERRSRGFSLRIVASRRRPVRLHRRWQSWPSPLEFPRK